MSLFILFLRKSHFWWQIWPPFQKTAQCQFLFLSLKRGFVGLSFLFHEGFSAWPSFSWIPSPPIYCSQQVKGAWLGDGRGRGRGQGEAEKEEKETVPVEELSQPRGHGAERTPAVQFCQCLAVRPHPRPGPRRASVSPSVSGRGGRGLTRL